MSVLAENGRRKLWFGTLYRMEWLPTPNRGADVSPTGWSAGGELLSGGAYQLGSFNSAKNYQFEWPSSSSRQAAQLMKSYADGSYGRGLIYFLDPLTYNTNVLPALWADPSMAIGSESNTLVPGITPTGTPTSGNPDLRLPVRSAFYDLTLTGTNGPDNLDDSNSVFVPIPEGYSLALGAVYSATGSAGVFYSPVFQGGAVAGSVQMSPVDPNGTVIINTVATPTPGQIGVRIWAGKTSSGPASITLSAMTGRLLKTDVSSPREIARNYFTNPNLKGDGTWAEVYRNYFTNPNLVGDGTWAEVRRNRAPIPVPDATWLTVLAGSGTSGSAVGRVLAGAGVGGAAVYEAELTAAVTETRTLRILGGPVSTRNIPVTPGETLEVSADVSISSGGVPQNARLVIGYNNSSNSYLTEQSSAALTQVSLDPANPTRMSMSHVVPAGAAFAQIMVQLAVTTTTPVGTKVRASRYMAGSGAYLDGNTKPAGIFQPEDFRVRWLGTPNASESVMEGELVPNVMGDRAVAIRSSWEGKPAVRLIAMDSTTNSKANITIPAALRSGGGTALATLHMKPGAVVPGNAGTTFIRRARVTTPDTWAEAPAVTGDYPFRINFGALSSQYVFQIGSGAVLGGPDVWYTDIGMFAAGYTGPVFSGDAVPSSFTQPEDFRARWVGAVNASESVIEGERVRGLDSTAALPIKSTRNGKPAVRVVPISSTQYSSVYFTIPTANRSSGTFMATVHQDAAVAPPLAAPTDRVANIMVLNPEQRATPQANQAGSRNLSLAYTETTSSHRAYLYHGGAIGSGDLWWTDIGLFGPGYAGVVFSGSSAGTGSVAYSWAGTPDNSESIATFTPPELMEIQNGPWIGGQGHSGCRFTGYPTYINNTGTDGGQVSYAASFREVGSWVMG